MNVMKNHEILPAKEWSKCTYRIVSKTEIVITNFGWLAFEIRMRKEPKMLKNHMENREIEWKQIKATHTHTP